MKIAALLLAKSKSSFKDKNIIPVNGKPVMAYPMLCAKNVKGITNFYISSDSEKYLLIANEYGYDGILRPKSLSTKTAKSDDAVKHAYDTVSEIKNSDILIVQHANVVTIYPELIDIAINILKDNKEITSVVPAHINMEYNPYRCFFLDDKKNLKPSMDNMAKMSPNRQELPSSLFLDHSFWCIRTSNINSNFSFSPWNSLGDKIRPIVCEDMFDIHDEEDLKKSINWLKLNKEKLNYL